MYRTLILAAGVMVVSESCRASEAYTVNFPSLFDIPIFSKNCDGMDLPCSPNMASFVYGLQPFKLPQSLLRTSPAPRGKGNTFGFVEVAEVDHGKEDYARLQGIIDEANPLVERFWFNGIQESERKDSQEQSRFVRAVLPSENVEDAIALCSFSERGVKPIVPERCVPIAFRSQGREFLLASIGLKDGPDDLREMHDHGPGFFSKWFQTEDSKEKILKSRHQLERKCAEFAGNIVDNLHLVNNVFIRKKITNFDNKETNGSKIEYYLQRKWDNNFDAKISFKQDIELHFHIRAGSEWEALYTDGTIGSGIELQDDTRDWSVALDWEIRTAANNPMADLQKSDLSLLRKPQAIGTDIVREVRAKSLDAMREICSPAKAVTTKDEVSGLKGYLIFECRSD